MKTAMDKHVQHCNLPSDLHFFEEEELSGDDWVGNGGFGFVVKRKWKCETRTLEVAEKKLVTYSNNGEKCDLEQEARILHTIQHKHVVKLFGVRFTSGNKFCLVMEYMKYGSCSDFFKKKPSNESIPIKYRISLQVSETMQYLHSQKPKMLHLDLKAANVLLDDRLNVKICDFGLAQLHTVSRLTQQSTDKHGNAGGTITHIAPEHLDNPNSKPTSKSDVYSYGVFQWELIAGKEPFSNALNRKVLQENIIKGSRPDKNDLPIVTPTIFVTVMEKAWNSDPTKRPEFADIFAELTPMPYSESSVEQVVDSLLAKCSISPSTSSRSENGETYNRRQIEDCLLRPRFFSQTDGQTRPKDLYRRALAAQDVGNIVPTQNPTLNGCEADRDSGNASFDTLHQQQRFQYDRLISDVTVDTHGDTSDVQPLVESTRTTDSSATTVKSSSHKRCCGAILMAILIVAGMSVPGLYFLLRQEFCQNLTAGDHQHISCDHAVSSTNSSLLPRGTKCRITCDRGYGIRNGSTLLSCVASLTWSTSLQPCAKLGICSKLNAPANKGSMECTNIFYEMSVCSFSCPLGYRLRAGSSGCISNVTTCQRVGKNLNQTAWSNPVPYCEQEVTCKGMPSSMGTYTCKDRISSVIDDAGQPHKNGTSCILSCPPEKAVFGSTAIVCLNTGDWNDTSQTCKPACPHLATPFHSNLSCTHQRFVLSVCAFECAAHYILLGKLRTSCKSNLRWTNRPPRCVCPACRCGDRCQYNCTWAGLTQELNRSMPLPLSIFYQGREVKCIQPHPHKYGSLLATGTSWTCRCVDYKSNRGRQCYSFVNLLDACEKSLSALILLEAYLDFYQLPCDADSMSPAC